MRIEVTDLWDAYFELAQLAWRRLEFQQKPGQSRLNIDPHWYELDGLLEQVAFLGSCRRRIARESGNTFDQSKILELLEVCDSDGNRLEGAAGRYRSSSFDWGTPQDESVDNAVVGGDMSLQHRPAVRLFVTITPNTTVERDARKSGARPSP